MRYRKKLIGLCVVLILLVVIQVVLPYNPYWTIIYADYVFVPYQSFRNVIFGWSQLSFGDIMYLLLGVALVVMVVKWVYYIISIKRNWKYLLNSAFNFTIVFASVYLLFLIGWGGNYYKPSLTAYWQMNKDEWHKDSSELQFDKLLIDSLNVYAALSESLPFKKVHGEAMDYYKEHTDCKARLHGLNIKPSIYGFLMQHLGIQGYYNPLTGEAQVNRFLPSFMLPFVVVHEMAHQAGIAAEDDANLMAYTISVKSGDPTFRYSAYLNMWLYNHHRLRRRDSTMADELKAQLNSLTLQHLDTLRQIRERYRSDVSLYSSSMYDVYLKMLQQKEGIMSYNQAVITAWAWEQLSDSVKRKNRLLIP